MEFNPGTVERWQQQAILKTALDPEKNAGVTVSGMKETRANMKMFAAYAVYASVMTSRRIAKKIFDESQRHVPYQQGRLYDSAEIHKLDDLTVPGTGEFDESNTSALYRKFSTTEAQGEATDFDFPAVTPFWATKTMAGTKMIAKYGVSYSADHAVYVHENPDNRIWSGSMDPAAGPKHGPHQGPEDWKWDHYLSRAFEKYAPDLSKVARAGILSAMAKIDIIATAQAPAIMGPAARSMAPRLVKK